MILEELIENFDGKAVSGFVNGLFVFPARLITNGIIAPIRGTQRALVSGRCKTITMKDGWNWSERPKKISNKRYDRMKSILLNFAQG